MLQNEDSEIPQLKCASWNMVFVLAQEQIFLEYNFKIALANLGFLLILSILEMSFVYQIE